MLSISTPITANGTSPTLDRTENLPPTPAGMPNTLNPSFCATAYSAPLPTVVVTKICSFAAVARPGYNKSELEIDVNELKTKYNADVRIIEVSTIDVSSSEIRYNIKNGDIENNMINYKVMDYILNNGLYR